MAGSSRPPWVPARPPGAKDLPYDDGEPMETPRHRRQMNILIESLEHALKDRDDVYVGGNMFFYFNQHQIEENDFRGPDVFVVLDTEPRERLSWVVWEEGGVTPDVIIELTSPMTSAVDRGEKMELYAKVLSVGEYYIYDPLKAGLEGYALDLTARRFRALEKGDNGVLSCKKLDLNLKVVEASDEKDDGLWLRWLDKNGNVLPTPLEEALHKVSRSEEAIKQVESAEKRIEDAEKRAEDAKMLVEEAEQRAFEAEKKADKSEERAEEHTKRADDQSKRAETEKQRADSEARRADAEAKRANAEAKRAKELAEKVATLENAGDTDENPLAV